METTWIEVADNAVKILGSAIVGGWFAWRVAKYNAEAATGRFLLERKLLMLMEAAKALDGFYLAFDKFYAALCGIDGAFGARATCGLTDEQFRKFISDRRADAVQLRMKALVEMVQDTFAARAQLQILRETECIKRAEELFMAIHRADESFKMEEQPPDSIDLVAIRREMALVRDARETFYDTIAATAKLGSSVPVKKRCFSKRA